MILINNPWGESNEKGLKAALAAKNLPYAGIEKFEANDVDVVPQLTRLKQAGADVLFLVANVGALGAGGEVARPHGLGRADRLALGPGGRPLHRARRAERGEGALHPDLQLLRQAASPKASAVLTALKTKYPEIKALADVTPAVGIANAYDAMHLTALAIAKAGSTEGAEDPRGLLRDRQVRGADQDLPEAVHADEPRCADGERLSLHLLQGRRDPAADELASARHRQGSARDRRCPVRPSASAVSCC